MIKVWVAGISTVLEPSTTASTTTEITGIFDTAALGAPFSDAYRGCTLRRDRFSGNAGAE